MEGERAVAVAKRVKDRIVEGGDRCVRPDPAVSALLTPAISNPFSRVMSLFTASSTV